MASSKQAIEILSRKWHPRIIHALLRKGDSSFSSLREELDGISNKVLSNSLQDLMEMEIVEKVEDDGNERYALTRRGKDMKKILDAAREWDEKFSREDQVSILIIEDDDAQAEIYRRWLQDDFDTSKANTATEAYEKLERDTDIILLDRDLKTTTAKKMLEESSELRSKSVILLTGVTPEKGILDMDIEGYLTKPVKRDELEETVYRTVNLLSEDARKRELASLLAKKAALDRGSVESEEAYQELLERIDDLSEKVNELPDGFIKS